MRKKTSNFKITSHPLGKKCVFPSISKIERWLKDKHPNSIISIDNLQWSVLNEQKQVTHKGEIIED